MFFLVKNFNKQKQEYAMKKDLKCDPCDKVYVNQQLWISMNSCKTKWYVFNAQGVALICQCWQVALIFQQLLPYPSTWRLYMKDIISNATFVTIKCQPREVWKHLSDPNMKKSNCNAKCVSSNLFMEVQWCHTQKNAHGNKFTFTINAITQMFAAGN